MSPFFQVFNSLIKRELRLAIRHGADSWMVVMFFVLVVGTRHPDPHQRRRNLGRRPAFRHALDGPFVSDRLRRW